MRLIECALYRLRHLGLPKPGCLLLLGVLAVCGSASVSGAAPQAESVSIEFRVLALEEDLRDIVYYTGKHEVEINAKAFRLSAHRQFYRGSPQMRFFRKPAVVGAAGTGIAAAGAGVAGAEAGSAGAEAGSAGAGAGTGAGGEGRLPESAASRGDGSMPEAGAPAASGASAATEPVAEVVLPPDAKRVLLLFSPAGGGTYRAFAMRNDGEDFSPGSVRMVNLTAKQLVVRCGGKGSSTLLPIAPGKEAVTKGDERGMSLEVAVEVDGKWQRELSNVIGVEAGGRSTVFFINSEAEFFKQKDGDGNVIEAPVIQMFVIDN